MCDLSLSLEDLIIFYLYQYPSPLPTHKRTHTHTHPLISFPFPLPVIQENSVKNALLVSMETQEFLDHLANHVPATTTLM